jgi:hypothetical protein
VSVGQEGLKAGPDGVQSWGAWAGGEIGSYDVEESLCRSGIGGIIDLEGDTAY